MSDPKRDAPETDTETTEIEAAAAEGGEARADEDGLAVAQPRAGEVEDAERDAAIAAAMAELEAELARTTLEREVPEEGPERYIALLEDEVSQLGAQVAEKEAARAEAEARADRAHDEIEDAKERLARESEAKLQRSTDKVLLALVELCDDLERAIEAARAMDHNPEVVSGIELVSRRFQSTLAGFGVERQEPLGAPFDPAQHEAVSVIPAPTPQQKGTIIAVTRPGYTREGAPLRPAQVVVAKAD